MAQLQTQKVLDAGLSHALQAASSGGDSYAPTSETFLLVKNADSAQHTVTVHTTATAFGQPISNVAIVIPAGAEVMTPAFAPGMVAGQADGMARLTYDAVTGLTLAAIQVGS